MIYVVLLLIGGILLFAALWIVSTYNKLVSLNALAQEGLSGIDVQLKKRHDLVANLVETVKGYAAHEREVLEKVTQARTNTIKADSLPQKALAEEQLTGALKTLFAVAERYPDLKANQNFLHLQQELANIEQDLQLSRRYYNGAARNYNIIVSSFFSSYIAHYSHFKPKPYFEIHAQERQRPDVKF